jgi:hypothetical protein
MWNLFLKFVPDRLENDAGVFDLKILMRRSSCDLVRHSRILTRCVQRPRNTAFRDQRTRQVLLGLPILVDRHADHGAAEDHPAINEALERELSTPADSHAQYLRHQDQA